MRCVTDSSFHVMQSIVVNKYSAQHQGECPSLGFRLNGIHSVTTFTLNDIINKRQIWVYNCWHCSQLPQGSTGEAYLQGYMCFVCMPLHLSVCDFLVCLLVFVCVLYLGASVCNAAVNSLWLNHKLRAMRECCQFSTGEGIIHSVSDAINQIKHPSALLEEFL